MVGLARTLHAIEDRTISSINSATVDRKHCLITDHQYANH